MTSAVVINRLPLLRRHDRDDLIVMERPVILLVSAFNRLPLLFAGQTHCYRINPDIEAAMRVTLWQAVVRVSVEMPSPMMGLIPDF